MVFADTGAAWRLVTRSTILLLLCAGVVVVLLDGSFVPASAGEQALRPVEIPEEVSLEQIPGRIFVVVNIPARMLRVYRDGRLFKEFPVGIGRRSYPGYPHNSKSRVGTYVIRAWIRGHRSRKYPYRWYDDKWRGVFGAWTAVLEPSAAAQHIHGVIGPVDMGRLVIGRVLPEPSPLETPRRYRARLLGWDYGLSHGCLRMSNRDIATLRRMCPVGTWVRKIYCLRERFPAAAGRWEERHYPDVYGYRPSWSAVYYPQEGRLVGYRDPTAALGRL